MKIGQLFESWMLSYLELCGSAETLGSAFRVLNLTGQVDELPCGCRGTDDQVILLHYGNMLYCGKGKAVRHPTECHQVVYPKLSEAGAF